MSHPHHVQISLTNGETVAVEGTVEEVEKILSDAARSGQSRMAWFQQGGSEERIGVNPAHVAVVKASHT